MDTVSQERRSKIMSNIRSRDTQPELVVRRYLHSIGLRFRTHRRDLPGRPDIVFPSRKLCVFVHGCFWHGCAKCVDGTRAVKSNSAYWTNKVKINQARDARNIAHLEQEGWKVATIWECEIARPERLRQLGAAIKRLRTKPQAKMARKVAKLVVER